MYAPHVEDGQTDDYYWCDGLCQKGDWCMPTEPTDKEMLESLDTSMLDEELDADIYTVDTDTD